MVDLARGGSPAKKVPTRRQRQCNLTNKMSLPAAIAVVPVLVEGLG